MKKNQKGFTLIELMIVIAIIAILMAYALPAYRDYTVRAKRGECGAVSNGLKTAMVEYNYKNLEWPANMGELNFTGATSGENISALTVGGPVISCAMEADAGGDTITWTATLPANTAAVTWTCDDPIATTNPNPDSCPDQDD